MITISNIGWDGRVGGGGGGARVWGGGIICPRVEIGLIDLPKSGGAMALIALSFKS